MPAPRFTVISPMFNVARYLPEYFASLDAQTVPAGDIEIILVDDGSTDDTRELAEAFARDRANVRVVGKANGGQASARNLGLEHATGDWVTFPDPDDVLGATYLADVAALMDTGDASVAMYTARMLLWFEDDESERAVRDVHALGKRFENGTRHVDLDAEPEIVQAHVTTGFLRRALIEQHGLRFRESLRLRFEDGNFVTRYLLMAAVPRVGMVATADYLYRQRSDASSTIQSSAADPRKYVDTVRYGYQDVVDAAEGTLPRWAQNLILYDLLWIFRSSTTAKMHRVRFPDAMHEEIHETLPRVLSHIDDDAIHAFRMMPVADWMRDAVLLLKGEHRHGRPHFGAIDAKRGLALVSYRYVGEPPAEEIRVGGERAEPRFTKDWSHELLGRHIVWQRMLWVAAEGAVELTFDGQPQRISSRTSDEMTDRIETQSVRTVVADARKRAEPATATVRGISRLRRRVGIALREVRAVQRERCNPGIALRRVWSAWRVMAPGYAKRFASAWVFMDRDVDANDSGEVLYRWIARHRPDVNAWFVLRRDSADWSRLEREGVRLVAYGSTAFAALMLSAEHVASSHADRFVTDPIPKRYGRRAYNFTFLQHGVIKSDISRWVNSKSIATLVASTQDEYDYLTGGSPYRVGSKEVRLTGLPRFDALLEQDRRVSEADRDLILVMPTWRDYLVGAMTGSSRERAGAEGFENTAYARALSQLLASEELAAAAHQHGARIVLMPHPNMHMFLDRFELPSHVEVRSYDDVDVREMIARARVLLTDYSSIAFNMAYVQRPVVYYQFDREEFLAGHTERPGYFEYDTHGFGPVVEHAAGAVDAIVDALTGEVDPVYLARMQATFPVRDGQNSRRVFDAMVESRRLRSQAERRTAAPLDTWESVAGA